MPRPWDNRNYSEEDIAMNYGPAVAPNGTTREEFYDSMAAHGWNKPGDDQAIAHMYMKLISLMSTNNADRGAMIALMSRTVNSPADKLTVIRDIASRPSLVPNANEQLANDDRRYEFIVNMQVRGFNKPGDEELLGTVSSLPNKVTRGNEEFLNPEQRRFFNLIGRTYRGDTIPERQAFLNGVNRYYDIELSEAEKEDHQAERAAVDQQISKYDRFVNNGVNNDTLGAALEEEERRRTARNIYYDTKERLHENVREPYRRFMDIYGPNAALPENLAFTDREAYNNIALPVPEGLDELTVTAIMIGACMNPSRLGKGEFNNVIGGGNSLSSDQMLFMSNVPTNHSTEAAAKFGPVMLEARKEALEALQRYQQGDPSAAKALLKNFADYEYSSLISSGIAADTMNQSTVNPEQSGHKLFAEVMEKDALGLSQEYGSKANDIPNLRTKVFGKAFDAMTAAENGRKNILNGFFDMNEEEKEEAVEDMLLSQYISLIPKKVSQERNKDVDETLSNALLRHGIAPDTALGQADMDFSLKLRDVYARGTITDIEVFVAENDMQQIKDLYLPEIRKSARYKAIMGSKNKDELADNIIAAEKDMQTAGKTVAELLPGVKLPNGAEKYNSVMEYGFEKDCLRIKKDYVKEVCFGENGLFKDELDDFAPASNKSEDIKKCYINFMKMKKEIDKIDDDSKEFNSIKHYTKKLGQTLEALSKKDNPAGADDMEDLRLNAESLRSVCTKWQNTFGIDQKIEDDMKIGRLCRIAIGIEGNAHRISEDVRIETGRKCCNRYLGKIMEDSFFSEDKFKLFYGEKFSDPEKRSISSAYTTSRSAVISASVFALLNKGYKYDDIFDDSKLVKEKQEMFEAVIERMRSDVPAEEHKKNQEWLAENYYEGHKKAVGLLSSAARDIDFNNPEILSDPKFMRFFNLAYCDFDCYQEMKRCCGNEILAVAQKEKPDITLERLNDLWDDEVINSRLIVAQITHFKEDIEKFAGNSRHNDHMIGALVFHRYALKRIGSYIEEEKKKPNGDLLAGGNADEKYCFDHTLASAYPEFQKRFRYLAKDPVTANDLIGAVMKDEFFSDLHVEFDRQKNVVRKITGTYPNDIKAKALAEKYRFMSETAMDDRLSAVAAMADDAQKNVFRGSREYDEAISSIKALDAAYKTLGTDKTTDISRTEELEKAQQAMEKARRDIERYIKRKEDQGLGNYNADAKTQKRINAMRLALELVNDVRYDIEDRVIEVGTKEAERSNRRIKNEDITSANNYRQELEIETAGISDRNLRRAAEGALDAVGKLNKLTPPDRTRPLSEQEVEKARLYMSKVTFYEMIRDKINPMVPNGKENYDTAIKDFSKLSLMKTLTRDLNHEQIKDFLASPRPFVKDVIETYGKLKMGSEKSADAPKRLSNKQKTVSKDPMKHGK